MTPASKPDALAKTQINVTETGLVRPPRSREQPKRGTLVRFTGFREHMNRLALEHTIQDFTRLSRSASRELVDELYAAKSPEVTVSHLSAARWLRAYAAAVGAHAEVITETAATARPR